MVSNSATPELVTAGEIHGRQLASLLLVLPFRTTMPVVAVTGEFTWGPQVLVISEYAFGVSVDGVELRLSDEHTEYG